MENELKIHADDLVTVKCVLTAMGYATKSSIVNLKSTLTISKLENEYMKLLGSNSADSIQNKFPELRLIPSFSSGMISTLLAVVSQLKKPKHQDINSTKMKLFEQLKKVCSL